MADFDYKKGWAEVINPAFHRLPRKILNVYDLVVTEAADLHQLPVTLDMPWTKKLQAAFADLGTVLLSKAARIIYFYGHWSSAQHADTGGGGTWKFAHYADQELRKRLPLPGALGYRNKVGFGVEIHEGAFRVTWASPDCWCWEEIAPATKAGLTSVLELTSHLSLMRSLLKNERRHVRDDNIMRELNKPEHQNWNFPFWKQYNEFIVSQKQPQHQEC